MRPSAIPLTAPTERGDVARIPADPSVILATLPTPIFAVDAGDAICFANVAAQHFFQAGPAALLGRSLTEWVRPDSPLVAVIHQARAGSAAVSEYDATIEAPRLGHRMVAIDAVPMVEQPGVIAVSLHERSVVSRLDRQLVHRGAARSVTAMAAILAHEIKNPLSGIRGAAQLLAANLAGGERDLTALICDETDRITALVDRMEMFTDVRPIARTPVNIHAVLDHVRKLAGTGFARGPRFITNYDPSLPLVQGNRDLLVQLFLNLVKNAAEAVDPTDGVITLTTRFQQGIRLSAPAAGSDAPGGRVQLPLIVTVEDNGAGVPEDIQAHVFEPFVTTKIGGKGLGLALAAKIVGDHGGIIELASEQRRTQFTVMLPMAAQQDG